MYYIKPTNGGHLTSLFSNSRINPVLGIIRPHQGSDIGASVDDIILAMADGIVRVADNFEKTGFGKYIVITHSNGQETLYAHLAIINVKVGQSIKQGSRIGLMGNTGNSTGKHLHVELSKTRWTNDFNNKLDPLLHFVDPVTKEIQKMLNRLGEKLTEDGIYGDATISAVSKYQRNNKLTTDGVCGRGSYAHLVKTVSSLPVVSPKPKPTVPTVPTVPTPPPMPQPAKPTITKEEEQLDLTTAQRKELAGIFKKAREKGLFTSDVHEKSIVDGTMSISRLLYLQSIIAGASLNNGKRVI